MECNKCETTMVEGKALKNTLEMGIPDFEGNTKESRGQTLSRSGKAKMVDVWKCPDCGKSIEK